VNYKSLKGACRKNKIKEIENRSFKRPAGVKEVTTPILQALPVKKMLEKFRND
jgi:hypothetical protein